VIDAHVHAFPTAEWGRSWQTEARFEPVRDGTLDDVTARMEAAGIEAGVLLLFARPGGRSREEAAGDIRALNRWGLDVARRDPRFLPFVGVDPNVLSPDELVAEIRDGTTAGARGVKIVPPAMQRYADDPLLEPVFATAVELGLPVLSQSGAGGSVPPGPRGPFGRPGAWDGVLSRHKDLRVVLAHMGHGFEDELVELMRAHDNVVTDTSLRLGHPRDEHPWDDEAAERLVALIRRVGAERVLFGTNYPIADPVEYVDRFNALPLTSLERELIGRENASVLIGYPPGGPTVEGTAHVAANPGRNEPSRR
jgi:predicted TIM-barrel fold metal-dependent hydrolase